MIDKIAKIKEDEKEVKSIFQKAKEKILEYYSNTKSYLVKKLPVLKYFGIKNQNESVINNELEKSKQNNINIYQPILVDVEEAILEKIKLLKVTNHL